MVLLENDTTTYSRPENLQFEKTGSGVPPRSPIDLYFQAGAAPHFVEFKYWHTMLKVRDGEQQIGKGNNTLGDVEKWLNDFHKLLQIDNSEAHRWFLLVAQLTQYEGSSSRLPFEALESRQADLSPRRLADAGTTEIKLANGLSGSAKSLFEPVVSRSPEGIRFGIYGLELWP